MKSDPEYPYPECKKCKTLGDCPYREVLEDGLGSVMPPSDCPKWMDMLRENTKMKKIRNVKPN